MRNSENFGHIVLGTKPKLMHKFNERPNIVLFSVRCNKIEPALLPLEWKI